MKSKLFGVVAVAALAGAISIPLSAQSLSLTANVPFEFTVGNVTMPAGEYRVLSTSTRQIIKISNETQMSAVALVATLGTDSGTLARAGSPRLIFNRYGNHYALAQIWDGSQYGREVPKNRSERELAAKAPAEKVEILAMLMHR